MGSTELKKYLTEDARVQEIVAGRCGALYPEELEEGEREYADQIVANGKNPKKWKRMSKFTVGGPSDEMFGEYYPQWKGCIAREFYLEDTDHVTIILITRNDNIIAVEDFSD